MSSQPKLLCIVLNYHTPELSLRAAGAALAAMRKIDGEVILIDNDSQDGSEAKLRAGVAKAGWSGARVLQTGSNGGFGAGNNVGIQSGLSDGRSPDFVYILNPDALPQPDAIQALLDYLAKSPHTGMAGSYIFGEDVDPENADKRRKRSEAAGAVHRTAFRFPTCWSEFEGAAHFGPLSWLLRRYIVAMDAPETTCEVDWVAGASLMLRRTMLDEIGLFDEDYFLYFEETDLCMRAHRAGWRTAYVCESQVSHIGSASTGMKTWTRVPRYWFDSRLRYFVKNHGIVYAALATALHLAGAILLRMRQLVDRRARTRGGPPGFVRNMAAHALGTAFGPRKQVRSLGLPQDTGS